MNLDGGGGTNGEEGGEDQWQCKYDVRQIVAERWVIFLVMNCCHSLS